MAAKRKIIHIDMDCFYAAVEIHDNPLLQGKPVAIGGSENQRGVLCTCNYEARKFGCHAAMASSHALRLCPDLILLPVNMQRYKDVSKEIRKIFTRYTDLVEPLSLDEAYLDVTECDLFNNNATQIALAIRDDIYSGQHITASAGIAPNKFLAKVASDWNKPNGQFVIKPHHIDAFVKALPVTKIFGVGKVTAKKMQLLDIETCDDLQKLTQRELQQSFGKFGHQLYDYARGIDNRPVEPHRERKSVSIEHTFPKDLVTIDECYEKIPRLITDLEKRLIGYDNRIKRIFVKLKFNDFQSTTAEQVYHQLSAELFTKLIEKAWRRQEKPVRLMGIGVHLDANDHYKQSLLF